MHNNIMISFDNVKQMLGAFLPYTANVRRLFPVSNQNISRDRHAVVLPILLSSCWNNRCCLFILVCRHNSTGLGWGEVSVMGGHKNRLRDPCRQHKHGPLILQLLAVNVAYVTYSLDCGFSYFYGTCWGKVPSSAISPHAVHSSSVPTFAVTVINHKECLAGIYIVEV
jgi:hypothetical protein